MKRVERFIPARTVIRFQCEICGVKYRKESAAIKCESKGTEVQKFNIGDSVRAFGKRECYLGKRYTVHGKVIKMIGPRLVSMGYVHWVRTREKGWCEKHVFQCEVEYICPICHKKKTALYFAPELKKLD